MTQKRVELVHFSECPHVDDARENLRAALHEVGREPEWTEWDVNDDATPDDRRDFPSPTVLVDDEPVEGQALEAGAAGCRVGGAPSAEAILRAFRKAR